MTTEAPATIFVPTAAAAAAAEEEEQPMVEEQQEQEPQPSAGSSSAVAADSSPALFENLPSRENNNDDDDDDDYKKAATTNAAAEEEDSAERGLWKHDQQQAANADETLDKTSGRSMIPLWMTSLVVILVILSSAALVVGLVALKTAQDNNNSSNQSTRGGSMGSTNNKCNPTTDTDCVTDGTSGGPSLLETVYERGILRCGSQLGGPGFFVETGNHSAVTGDPIYVGMDVDLCRALAAAIFGDQQDDDQQEDDQEESSRTRTRMVPRTGVDYDRYFRMIPQSGEGRFRALEANEIDVMFRTSHTMDRDVAQASVEGRGFDFGPTYFYDGAAVGGVPEFVDCVDNLTVTGECVDLKLCALQDSTLSQAVEPFFPEAQFVFRPNLRQALGAFMAQDCNVIVGTTLTTREFGLRQLGYQGPFQGGSRVFSREPAAVVSRGGDPVWTDFLTAVLHALVYAEESEIVQRTALDEMPAQTTLFLEPPLVNMFRHAVAASGNMGEIYGRNVQHVYPRSGLNELNTGAEPRLWSFPFGNLNPQLTPGRSIPRLEDISPTVQAIKARGHLQCGFAPSRGFAELDLATKRYRGFDIEWCRALSAALFDGDDDAVSFVALDFSTRFVDMERHRRVDVLAMVSTWTLAREVREPSIGKGLSFSDPYLYVGNSFAGLPEFIGCVDNLVVVSSACQEMRICTFVDTTLYDTVVELLGTDFYVVGVETSVEMVDALISGRCNLLYAETLTLQEDEIRSLGYTTGDYVIHDRVFAVEPLALVTRQDDVAWSDFVRWIVWAVIYAEEEGITQATASEMPRTSVFGELRRDAFFHAVNAVGNYGELYERNFGDFLPRNVVNELNDNSEPRLYSIPGFDQL